MSNIKIEKKLEQAMRFIYAHFLEDDEKLTAFMQSRTRPRPNIRHLVRKHLYIRYKDYGCTYQNICNAEGNINGGQPLSHSTVVHSVYKPPEKYENHNRAKKTIRNLADQFEDYWLALKEPTAKERLEHYNDIPHHVLALMMVMIEQLGWVERYRLDGFYKEFREISESMIDQ